MVLAGRCSPGACVVVPLRSTFALVVLLCLCLSLCLWFAKVTALFCRFICLLLVQKRSRGIALCFFHSFGVSSAVMPPRSTRNSLESSVSPVSSAPASTVLVTSIPVSTSVQASGTPASPSISPEFLASVIQAIQTPISAIIQQLLAAMVSAHSVSQGFLPIAAQGSSLATRAAHLDACGFHQPWSFLVHTGFLPLTFSSSTPSVPVAMPMNVLSGMLLSLVVPSFVPVFSWLFCLP